MDHPDPTPDQARAALASAELARHRIAALGQCPPGRHAAFGAVMALLVTGAGLPLPWQVAAFVIAMAAIVWIKKWDEKRYGVFINGYRRGATLPFTILLLVAMLGFVFLQIRLRGDEVPLFVPLAVGLAAFFLGTGASVIWSRIFRREMERLQGRLRARVGNIINHAAMAAYRRGLIDYVFVRATA